GFDGTLKVFFQPGEEISGGGKSMAKSGHLDDVEYLLAVHVGLGHPTGTVVAGMEKPLAMAHFDVTFKGESAHAGESPNEGSNALLAAATAVQNAYAIARHKDGMTRVNFGEIAGGTASNIVAEEVTLKGEVRGETNELMEYMKSEVMRILESAAEMHGCDVEPEIVSESPRADSDEGLWSVVADVAEDMESVDTVVPTVDFGASEDATFLMEHVQKQGGLAAYSIVGTDHPTGHHTGTFDVDEETIDIGIELLSQSIESLDD
ncbi:MAG: amidohydrolase, partial [Halobacteriaceae archaeon]